MKNPTMQGLPPATGLLLAHAGLVAAYFAYRRRVTDSDSLDFKLPRLPLRASAWMMIVAAGWLWIQGQPWTGGVVLSLSSYLLSGIVVTLLGGPAPRLLLATGLAGLAAAAAILITAVL